MTFSYEVVAEAMRTGEPETVDRAARTLRMMLTSLASGHDLREHFLIDLSVILRLRYENNGDLDDLAEAVRIARDAGLTSDPDRAARRLDALGTALRTWYEQTGEHAALLESIECARQVVRMVPSGDPNYGTAMANLATALHGLFTATEDLAVLNEALSTAWRAAEATSEDHPRHATILMGMCNLFQAKHTLTGDRSALDQAIMFGRNALAGSNKTGWVRSALLTNLGRALESRHWRTGDLDSLRESVRLQRQAVATAPEGHADVATYRLGLSGALRVLYDRTGDLVTLDEALQAGQNAAATVGPGHPFRINHLSHLAIIRQLRYAHTSDASELEAAVVLLREAAAESEEHPLRPIVSANFGNTVNALVKHTGNTTPLIGAIADVRAALAAIPQDHLGRGPVLTSLAALLETRYRLLGDPTALREAIELSRTVTELRSASTAKRVDAARAWGELATVAGLTALAAEGYARAVELLPLLAARRLRRHDSEHWLSRFPGLASDAAALALDTGSPDRAVELLELGRAVLLAQALDARTDLSELRDRDKALAEHFEWLSTRLEMGNLDSAAASSTIEDLTAAAEELDEVIAAIRRLPGLECFLLPPAAAELTAWAEQGPIIMVNVSRHRCDALLLTPQGVRSVPLPALTSEVVKDRVKRLLTALRADRTFHRARNDQERVISKILAWLWEAVVAPVLDALKPAPGQRVWWIPTGSLAYLPLHAAGDADESALDRVVSSYTPSIRALARARACAPGGARTLVVGMAETPGESGLPAALRETRLVAERAPNPCLLVGPEATHNAVIDALAHSDWAHFACHAATGRGPSDSQLLLHDHQQRPLDAVAVSRLRLASAELAYLSACDTAIPDLGLVDEVIHIASAFHLAGYARVIGTLWTVHDETAATIADLVYADLTAGQPNAERAASALHHAVTRMRHQYPDQPSRWASHIHIGA